MQETVTEETAKSFNVEKKLLDWCKERLKGYEEYATISDFSSSWRDGLAFNALVHSYGYEKIVMRLNQHTHKKTITLYLEITKFTVLSDLDCLTLMPSRSHQLEPDWTTPLRWQRSTSEFHAT